MENKPTYEELLDRVTEMELDLEALKTELLNANSREQSKPAPPHPRWMPKEDELYYTILGYGEISGWLHHNIDDNKGAIWRSSIDNVFRTEAEAEFAAERLKVLAEMREWAGATSDPWHIYYVSREKKVYVGEWMPHFVYGDLRFATKEDARNCINAVGLDRIQRYYLMIDENGDPVQIREEDHNAAEEETKRTF